MWVLLAEDIFCLFNIFCEKQVRVESVGTLVEDTPYLPNKDKIDAGAFIALRAISCWAVAVIVQAKPARIRCAASRCRLSPNNKKEETTS